MYTSVHTDHTGRLFLSTDHRASGWDGASDVLLTDAEPLPAGTRLVPLQREARAIGRDGRGRAIGRGRQALAAVLPAGHTRLLHPSYSEDLGAGPLEPLAYAALGADAAGDLVVAAAKSGAEGEQSAASVDLGVALRAQPRNDLLRQLSRCARENECVAAREALAGGHELPVPLGAPVAERPTLPIALRSGYPGAPRERAALHPSATEIASLVTEGITRVAFGRACDGEPLLALRALEEACTAIRERSSTVDIHLETTGCSASALRQAIDAGVTSVTVRLASAMGEMYRAVHGPLSHGWSDVRSSLTVAAEHGAWVTLAILVSPGITDRPTEMDALLDLVGDLPGGTIELRDLGADPVRAFGGLPRARLAGIRMLLERLGEVEHFGIGAPPAMPARH